MLASMFFSCPFQMFLDNWDLGDAIFNETGSAFMNQVNLAILLLFSSLACGCLPRWLYHKLEPRASKRSF